MRLVAIMCATATLAACAAPGPDYAGIATRLDQAREEIAPPLGATTYTLDSRHLLDQPGDENRNLAQSLRQLPGVTLGPNGQVRVRDQ
jgi:outer membrane receptor for ferrienterochelin and colicins